MRTAPINMYQSCRTGEAGIKQTIDRIEIRPLREAETGNLYSGDIPNSSILYPGTIIEKVEGKGRGQRYLVLHRAPNTQGEPFRDNTKHYNYTNEIYTVALHPDFEPDQAITIPYSEYSKDYKMTHALNIVA